MPRKVYALVTVRIVVDMEDTVDFPEFFNELEYDFSSGTEGANVVDMELRNYEVIEVRNM